MSRSILSGFLALTLCVGVASVDAAALRPAPRTVRRTPARVAMRSVAPALAPAGLAIGHQAIALPKDARVRKLPASAFVLRADAVKVHVERVSNSGQEVGPDRLAGLRTEAARQLDRALPRSKTVFYPMSGYDAGTPVHLFPDATTIIGIDNHPFLSPDASAGQIPYSKVGTHSFAYFHDVGRLRGVGPAIIGALHSAVPGFRLRDVTLVERDELHALARDDWSPSRRARPPGTAVHAIVEFDAGPGTPTRRYVHVNGSIEGEGVAKTWWWKMVDRLAPDAVLMKGAEHVLTSRGGAVSLRPKVDAWLRRSAGVLIEDDANYSEVLWDDDRRTVVPVHTAARSAVIPLKGWSFGYTREGRNVYVTAFDSDKK